MEPQLRAIMERVDSVERRSFVDLYDAARELGAGTVTDGETIAVWLAQEDDPGFSCIIDLARAPDPSATVERLEAAARSGGARVLGIDTHPDLDRRITYQWFLDRGYEVDCEECIWWRALAPFEPDALPHGLELRRADVTLGDTFAQVLNVGFGYPPDYVRGRAFAATIDRAGWFHYVAFVDGAPAAVSAMFVHDQVADCFVAATLPIARGRGAQTALIQRRLADGAAAGCELATAQSVVTNASPRNFARQGFQPVYRRWIYGKRLVND
jgi:hypothetical protein